MEKLESMRDRILICGVNWLGDAVMSLPAVQLFKRANPSCHITMLVKASVAGLWSLSAAVDEVAVFDGRAGGTLSAARKARRGDFRKAFVFPNSIRSALIPFLAAIPERIGMRGRQRAWLLTQVIEAPARGASVHQAWEYLHILRLDPPAEMVAPVLDLPGDLVEEARSRLQIESTGCCWVALIPGAARGPAKRWPTGHFIELGKALAEQDACRLLVLGSPSEKELCCSVAAGVGPAALNLAGQTSLPQFAALLAECRAAVTNDSGGMHLAAAAGTRVVAVYGLTDPSRTGPLGSGHRTVALPDIRRSRDIDRDSAKARACLESIAPGKVLVAVREVLSE